MDKNLNLMIRGTTFIEIQNFLGVTRYNLSKIKYVTCTYVI